MFTVVGCRVTIAISIDVNALGRNELDQSPGDFRTMVVLEKVTRLGEPYMGLAFGTGDVVGQVVLNFARTGA
jgi:hypothetical protein